MPRGRQRDEKNRAEKRVEPASLGSLPCFVEVEEITRFVGAIPKVNRFRSILIEKLIGPFTS
jgi:hypothetical protein